MKKVNLPLTTAVSAAMLASSACSTDREWQVDNNTKVCVDNSGNRVADDQCFSQSSYHWYYISRGGYVPRAGSPVSGGSWVPVGSSNGYGSAPESAPAGAITRGGFGGIGEGHAGGEGE
jgi:hypothetical protein